VAHTYLSVHPSFYPMYQLVLNHILHAISLSWFNTD